MNKEEIKALVAEMLASGDFNLEVDDAQVEQLVAKKLKPLTDRIEQLEAAAAKPSRIDAIAAASKPSIKAKLGSRSKEQRNESRAA